MSEACGDRPAGSDAALAGWKVAVLADFARWLEDLDEAKDLDTADGEDGGPLAGLDPGCDLHTLLTEMAALRQEVRLQTREQARALRHVEGEREALAAAVARLDEQAMALQREREAARQEQAGTRALLEDAGRRSYQAGVRDGLVPMLDVRDALERGRRATARVAGRRRWLRPVGLEEVTAGYEMALARFDRALTALGVAPVPRVGAAFDPRTMVAAAVRHEPGVADGVVVEVLCTGFVGEGEQVLRPAQVVVNRTAAEPT